MTWTRDAACLCSECSSPSNDPPTARNQVHREGSTAQEDQTHSYNIEARGQCGVNNPCCTSAPGSQAKHQSTGKMLGQDDPETDLAFPRKATFASMHCPWLCTASRLRTEEVLWQSEHLALWTGKSALGSTDLRYACGPCSLDDDWQAETVDRSLIQTVA